MKMKSQQIKTKRFVRGGANPFFALGLLVLGGTALAQPYPINLDNPSARDKENLAALEAILLETGNVRLDVLFRLPATPNVTLIDTPARLTARQQAIGEYINAPVPNPITEPDVGGFIARYQGKIVNAPGAPLVVANVSPMF